MDIRILATILLIALVLLLPRWSR
jgi:hypothetical protein